MQTYLDLWRDLPWQPASLLMLGLCLMLLGLIGTVICVVDAIRVERRHRREFQINPMFERTFSGHTHSYYHDKCVICGEVRTPIDRRWRPQ